MSARRRRAALSALGALLAALFCAILAASVDSGGRRGVLIALTLAWLVIAASCVVNLVRTKAADAPPSAPDTPAADQVGSDEPV